MNTPHKYAALIKAWADGATIQVRINGDGGYTWKDMDGPGGDTQPAWLTGHQYRLKPANVERFCPVFVMPTGTLVVRAARVTRDDAASTSHADHNRTDRLGGVIHLTINPDTLELVSATMEKV